MSMVYGSPRMKGARTGTRRTRTSGGGARSSRAIRSGAAHPGWGGARRGAGRPAGGPVPSERHLARPELAAHHPVHVTARVASPIGSRLQRGRIYSALRRALHVSLARVDFRIVHLAVLPTRVDLIIEADDKVALARGMQGFQVSAARWLNRAARRAGTVFVDRYRMTILRTRLAVRGAIGRLPLLRQTAWPQTWLLRVDAQPLAGAWFQARPSEDSS